MPSLKAIAQTSPMPAATAAPTTEAMPLTTEASTAAAAENVPADTVEDNGIGEQILAIEKAIASLQKALAQPLEIKATQTLLASLPVNAKNIQQRLERLTAQTTRAKREDFEEVEKKQEQITARSEALKTQQANVKGYAEQLSELQKQQESLNQLLTNPAHSAQISDEQRQKADQFKGAVEQLNQQLAKTQQAIEAQLTALAAGSKRLTRWHSALQLQRREHVTANRDNTELSQQASQLRKEIADLQTQFEQRQGSIDFLQADKNQRDIYIKSLQLWQVNLDKELIKIMERQSIDFTDFSLEDMDDKTLKAQYDGLLATRKQMEAIQTAIDNKGQELEEYAKMRGKQPPIEAAFNQRKQFIHYQYSQLQKQLFFFSDEIARREQLVRFSMDRLYADKQFSKAIDGTLGAWQQVGFQIALSFQGLLNYIKVNPMEILLTAVVACLLVVAAISASFYLANRFLPNKDDEDSNVHLLLMTVKKYRYLLIPLLLFIYLIMASELPHPSSHIILTLIYGVTVATAWLNVIRADGRLPAKPNFTLIRMAATLLLAALAMFYFIAQVSAIDAAVLSLCEKALMLSLILFVWLERKKFSHYLSLEQAEKYKLYRFYNRALKMLPWLIIGTSAVSLAGFSRLAWGTLNDIWEAMIFVALLTLGFRVINYLRKRAKLYSIKQFKHGAFVASDIISPLFVITKILWVWCVIALSFARLGLSADSYPVADFLLAVDSPLVTVGTTEVTLKMIVLSLLSLYLVFKFAHWLKTFSYHVIYARIQDLGVRDSLSIFTQYIMAVTGVLITLSVLGIDLTSLAVFAGALGVGVGLGLQDIAKNFISGILLLIERPLHNGDWVKLDEYEGTVKNIGMRAIRMETFDKQEVIIPNANAISNSFTNNTHSNAVLRTVLYIGADYDSEPDSVIEILVAIMKENTDIISTPAPKAVLWEYADSSINYRVQYYINTSASSLLDTRNAVLREIWHRFKAANIGIPYPQQDIHLHTVTSGKAD